MQVNNISSMMNFKSSKITAKAADVIDNVAQSVSKRSRQEADVITSSGCDYFMSKNHRGETVKITSLIDAAEAAGYKISYQPDVVTKTGPSYLDTPLGRVYSLEDVVNLVRKG